MSNKAAFLRAFACALLLSPSLKAQEYIDAPATTAVRGRVGAALDYKAAKGLHVGVEEELRFSEALRSYTTVSGTYKISKFLKAGVGYSLIALDGEEGWALRHRAYGDFTGSIKAGAWKFSLRERFQATYRPGEMNLYQNPRTALALKSRLKASYKFSDKPLEPYAGIEVRNTLNAVRFNESLTHIDYNDIYLNRARLSLGCEWRLNKKNSFDFYTLWDYTYDKDIDAKKTGQLKSITYETGYRLTLGVTYSFAL